MIYKHAQFAHKNIVLAGSCFLNSENTGINILFLHGGGSATKERTHYLRNSLAQQGYSSFGFDHTGHGETGGDLTGQTLSQRVDEAVAAIEQLNLTQPLTIVGSSMGGYVAIKLTERVDVKNLILFCPAVYHRDAYKVPFGEEFTAILRSYKSRENSDAYEILQKFTGNVYSIIGSQDRVIPQSVLELLEKNAIQAMSYEVGILENVDHAIHAWLEKNPEMSEAIAEKIRKFL